MASYTHEELELSQKHEDMWVLSVVLVGKMSTIFNDSFLVMKLKGLMNVFFSCRLGKRALLLQQMEAHYEQQKAKKKQQSLMSQAATERNAQILKVALLCAFCLYMH